MKKIYRIDRNNYYYDGLEMIYIGTEDDCINSVFEAFEWEPNSDLEELIFNAADENLHFFADDLLESCQNIDFIPYIETAIAESGSTETFLDLVRIAENNYLIDYLNQNLDTIIKNALNQYLKKTTFEIIGSLEQIKYAEQKISEFIDKEIDNFQMNSDASINEVYEHFENIISNSIGYIMLEIPELKIEIKKAA